MISAAFSIIKQSIALGCFPQLTVQHVSDKVGALQSCDCHLPFCLSICAVTVLRTSDCVCCVRWYFPDPSVYLPWVCGPTFLTQLLICLKFVGLFS